MTSSEEFRAKAATMRELAAGSTDPRVVTIFQDLAQLYGEEAERLDEQRAFSKAPDAS